MLNKELLCVPKEGRLGIGTLYVTNLGETTSPNVYVIYEDGSEEKTSWNFTIGTTVSFHKELPIVGLEIHPDAYLVNGHEISTALRDSFSSVVEKDAVSIKAGSPTCYREELRLPGISTMF